MRDFYDQIEEPVRDLVRLLRNNGFNTTCSCGHSPSPYVQMDWASDGQVTDLYNLLVDNGYARFEISAFWSDGLPPRWMEVRFNIPPSLVDRSLLLKSQPPYV